MPGDRFRDAAEQHTFKTATTMAADDDEIGRPFRGCLYDFVCRASRHDGHRRRFGQGQPLAIIGRQLVALQFGNAKKFAGRPGFGADVGVGVDNVDQRYIGAERAGKIDADLGGMRGNRFAVHGEQYSLEGHYRFPVTFYEMEDIARQRRDKNRSTLPLQPLLKTCGNGFDNGPTLPREVRPTYGRR